MSENLDYAQETEETTLPDITSNSNELDHARELIGSAIHAPDHYLDVIALACAATHKVGDFFTAPRILALGDPGSGKSTVLTVASYLAANATPATGALAMTAPSYVADFRMDDHGNCTHVIDEVHHLFGLAGSNGKGSKFYTYLNQGYKRDTAFAQQQENKVTLRVPIFGIVFMAGLGLACPPDMRERSIIIHLKKATGKIEVADFSDSYVREAFTYARGMLTSWAQRQERLNLADVKGLHPKLTHRMMDVWGPLFAVAKAAGDEWLERTLTAFERIELDANVPIYAHNDQVRADYLAYCEVHDVTDGVPSGDFAAYANSREHGAYLSMKPGQFKQFAVSVLGPTDPYYDSDTQKMRRGWSSRKHQMNLDAARHRMMQLEAKRDVSPDEAEWEDDF